MAAKESKFCDETLQDQRVPWYKWNAEHFICQDCYNETCQTEITITIWKKLKLAKRSENLLTNFHTFGIFSTGKFFFVKSKLDTGKHCRILVFSRLFINLEFTHYFAIFFPVSGCMKELFLLINLLYLYV